MKQSREGEQRGGTYANPPSPLLKADTSIGGEYVAILIPAVCTLGEGERVPLNGSCFSFFVCVSGVWNWLGAGEIGERGKLGGRKGVIGLSDSSL